MLFWDETDFMECLETLPIADEEQGTYHRYIVPRDGLTLVLTVEQYSGDISFCLYRDGIETPILEFHLLDCPRARYIKDQVGNRRDFLEFDVSPCNGRTYNRWDTDLIERGVRLMVKPHIAIDLF